MSHPFKHELLKLPKGLAEPAQIERITKFLQSTQKTLTDGGELAVTELAWTQATQSGLATAWQAGHLVQGLEKISSVLDNEKKGILAAAKRQNNSPKPRLSRLLLLSSDGSDRFYRQAESVLEEHANRLWGCVLSIDSKQLGEIYSPRKQPIKALMIGDRKCLEIFLEVASSAG